MFNIVVLLFTGEQFLSGDDLRLFLGSPGNSSGMICMRGYIYIHAYANHIYIPICIWFCAVRSAHPPWYPPLSHHHRGGRGSL